MADFQPTVYEVKSSSDKNKTYHVNNFRPRIFTCTCRGFRFNAHDKDGYKIRGKSCRHIIEIKERLNK